jgi:hypothetical protein
MFLTQRRKGAKLEPSMPEVFLCAFAALREKFFLENWHC